jgi:hypothetical protein
MFMLFCGGGKGIEQIDAIENNEDFQQDLKDILKNETAGEFNEDGNETSDKKSPEIKIIYPTENSKVCGKINIQVSATDADDGVKSVSFYIDNKAIGLDLTSPYQMEWDTTKFEDGEHFITVIAEDNGGLFNSSTITIIVDNIDSDCDSLPTVVIISPENNSYLNGKINIEAQASDDVGVIEVQFFIDNGKLITDEAVPYKAVWDTDDFKQGIHKIKAVAIDTKNQSYSNEIDVTVDRTPPFVSFISPEDNAAVNESILIDVNAGDNYFIKNVILSYSGTSSGSIGVINNLPYKYEWDIHAFSSGSYEIKAQAIDLAGLSNSASVNITIDKPPTVNLNICEKNFSNCKPLVSENVKWMIYLEADATDDFGIKNVEFFIDGKSEIILSSAPFVFSYDTSVLVLGDHEIKVTAVDSTGQEASAKGDIIVLSCDADGDGFKSLECSGNDCDDSNEFAYPGAPDNVGDNIDENCDGVDGVDADKDGVASEASGGTDCNDSNPKVKPGEKENCETEYDDNCNGDANEINSIGCITRFTDKDGDGYYAPSNQYECKCSAVEPYVSILPGDCDDNNKKINPGEKDPCDGVDNNCNGQTDEDLCEDGNLCTINDHCKNSVCVAGDLKDCEDGNPCTANPCDNLTGECLNILLTGGNCEDYDLCTFNDKCINGQCIGTQKLCIDELPCKINGICDKQDGKCYYQMNGFDCDDKDLCTVGDKCYEGECVGVDSYCTQPGVPTNCPPEKVPTACYCIVENQPKCQCLCL